MMNSVRRRQLERQHSRLESGLRMTGLFRARILDIPKPGKKFGTPLTDWFNIPNGAKTVGLNHVLDTVFRGGTPITAWYCGLIDDTGYSSDPAGDTAGSHGGWTELTTYTAGTRPQWSPGAAASGSVTISSAITLTTNADSLIRGIFVSSVNTKGASTGTLWSTAVEAAARSILSGQQYQWYYTVTLTP
jgi:hypothetical protein